MEAVFFEIAEGFSASRILEDGDVLRGVLLNELGSPDSGDQQSA